MKKLKIMIVFVVLILMAIVVSLLVINVFQNSSQYIANNAQLNNVGYLEHSISGMSKLFLVSANVSYGVRDGQDCFIITATIRNDYTVEQPPPLDGWWGEITGRAWFAVTATLYEGDSQVLANDITGAVTGSMAPPLGVPQHALYSGETDTIEIYMVTNSRSVDNYSINLMIVSSGAIP